MQNLGLDGRYKGVDLKLPEFDPELVTFESWKYSLDEAFQHLKWGDENPQRNTVLPLLLQNAAREFYRGLVKEVKDSYADTMQALSVEYPVSFH